MCGGPDHRYVAHRGAAPLAGPRTASTRLPRRDRGSAPPARARRPSHRRRRRRRHPRPHARAHDDGADGSAGARTAADLRRARLRGPDGALTDDCVPTLDEVLAHRGARGRRPAHRDQDAGARGHVRARAVTASTRVPGPRYQGLERKVLDALAAAGIADRCVVMAFNPAVVAQVRTLAPSQRTTLLVDRHVRRGRACRPIETRRVGACGRRHVPRAPPLAVRRRPGGRGASRRACRSASSPSTTRRRATARRRSAWTSSSPTVRSSSRRRAA